MSSNSPSTLLENGRFKSAIRGKYLGFKYLPLVVYEPIMCETTSKDRDEE
jgi:hypothetical protein